MTKSKTRNASKAGAAVVSEGSFVVEGPSAPLTAGIKGFSELASDARGAIFVEYLTLVCVVILGGSAAVVSLGQPLVHLYRVAQLVIGLPIP